MACFNIVSILIAYYFLVSLAVFVGLPLAVRAYRRALKA